MKYDFDKVVDRHGTNCLKYDFAIERGKPADILPLWVADMDFQTAPAILERLEETVKHGIFGYSDGKEGYFAAVQNWYRERFGWETKPEWLVKTPGVVFALAAAVRAYTKEGDGVLLQQPVYYPFSEVITDNGRKIVNSPLKITDGYYTMDFDDLETKIVENKVKLFLLCSPHNPVGRVWSEEELRRVGEICLRHGVLVVSDEIHSDFTREGHPHTVFAKLGAEFEQNCLICTAQGAHSGPLCSLQDVQSGGTADFQYLCAEPRASEETLKGDRGGRLQPGRSDGTGSMPGGV